MLWRKRPSGSTRWNCSGTRLPSPTTVAPGRASTTSRSERPDGSPGSTTSGCTPSLTTGPRPRSKQSTTLTSLSPVRHEKPNHRSLYETWTGSRRLSGIPLVGLGRHHRSMKRTYAMSCDHSSVSLDASVVADGECFLSHNDLLPVDVPNREGIQMPITLGCLLPSQSHVRLTPASSIWLSATFRFACSPGGQLDPSVRGDAERVQVYDFAVHPDQRLPPARLL